jgi:hypothetical protein
MMAGVGAFRSCQGCKPGKRQTRVRASSCAYLKGHTTAWVLENKRLTLHHGWLGFIIQSQLQAACIFHLPDWKLPCPTIPKNVF